jgi:branched-chain amino acid transport system ATP-binding protein
MTALLQLEGIVAGYGRGDILRGIDLTLEEGTVTCVVGPNGAGKSTVLKTLSGLLRAREGRILLDGDDIGRLSPAQVLARGVVHVAQDRSLFPLMTVWDNVLMGGHVVRDRALVRRRAEAIVERFALIRERRDERAGQLSGGQQKLVEIARALMLEPRLVLLDEPTMGLDPKARHLIFELVRELNEDAATSGDEGPIDELTPRELQAVAALVEQGSTSGAAHALGLSEGTVRAQLESVLEKLKVRTRTHAVAILLRDGLLISASDPDDGLDDDGLDDDD